ncbi:MAG TPA: diacylglycerol kinase family protein [Acidimicrobiales bacterium]|nr:diacylglycerol kinase family protein [Acidimicrobiales bacterium]
MAVRTYGSGRRPSVSQRVLAVVAFVTTAIVVIEVIDFLVGKGHYVVIGTLGLVFAIAGAWWVLTEKRTRRVVGAAAVLIGLGIAIAAMLGAGGDSEPTFLNLAVTVALLTVAVLAARTAMAQELQEVVGSTMRPVSPPSRPVLLCNPWSGGGKVQRFGLVELAASMGIETVMLDRGLDLEKLARESVQRGADCLGMAGGDGSQALVASIAVEHDLPFVCVSAGTRNHFALDLGLERDDPRQSVYAFRDAVERRVDYATVNGRFFVNNVSLGIYATIVQQPGYRENKSETSRRMLPELLGRTEKPFDLQFTAPDGSEVDGAFLIMVSNNPYVLGASLDVSQRRRLDSGQLGVFAVTATTGQQAAHVVSLALAHRAAKSGHAYEFASDAFEIRSRSGRAYAGIDGEALDLDTPMRFEIHPRGLRLLVPESNPKVAARRQARDVHMRDLVAIASGRSPVDHGPDRRGKQ